MRTPHPTTPAARRRLACALALLGLAPWPASPTWAADEAPNGARGWFAVALLPRVGEVLITTTQQGAGCVFTRLINALGAGMNPNNPNCGNAAAGTNYVQPGAQFNGGNGAAWNSAPQPGWQGAAPAYQAPTPGGYAPAPGSYAPAPGSYAQAPGGYAPAPGAGGYPQPGMAMQPQPQFQPPAQPQFQPPPQPAFQPPAQPPAPALNPQTASVLSTQPLLSFMVQKLADQTPRAPVVGLLAQDQLQAQNEPSFALTTGDAFAIRFATTVPGRVRMVNTDVDGQTSVSSLYEAVPGGDNRMPREHEGGILMTGKPGVEYLDLEFVPCISAALAQHPAVQPFAGQLPACSVESATRQYRPARADGSGALADQGGRAMNFPANTDPTQPVAIAPAGYAKGDALRFRMRIQHLARP